MGGFVPSFVSLSARGTIKRRNFPGSVSDCSTKCHTCAESCMSRQRTGSLFSARHRVRTEAKQHIVRFSSTCESLTGRGVDGIMPSAWSEQNFKSRLHSSSSSAVEEDSGTTMNKTRRTDLGCMISIACQSERGRMGARESPAEWILMEQRK